MASPTGTFVGLSLERLREMREIGIARATEGDMIGTGGGGKSSQWKYDMSVEKYLMEVNYAIEQAEGRGRARSTHFDVRRR